jgi:phage tail-like protein
MCARDDTEDKPGFGREVGARRVRPYSGFNFLVELDDSHPDRPDAGFQECSLAARAVGDHHAGDETDDRVREIIGLNKAPDVTLKRGVIGFGPLYAWLEAVHDREETEPHTVRIWQRSEDRDSPVATWVLTRARIINHVSGPFNAKGADAAIDELILACERIELEEQS